MDCSTRHLDCRIACVEFGNGYATVENADGDDVSGDVATAPEHLYAIGRLAENESGDVADATDELKNELEGVDVRLSSVGDTAWTVHYNIADVDDVTRDVGVATGDVDDRVGHLDEDPGRVDGTPGMLVFER